jgi:beta-glucosidase
MGAALARGVQSHNVIAAVKHFALNSIENARFKVDVRVDPRTLREVFLPHFKRVLDAGCASVMSAYNRVNGEYCGQNRDLLTGILRDEWRFDGFVHSDWGSGLYKTYGASAGLDVENPEPAVFGGKLLAAVRDGVVEPGVVDTACRRILRTFYRFSCAEDPLPSYPEDLVACEQHRALALEVARKSAVLLKNDGTLPIERRSLRRLAVLGALASRINTGDRGSSSVRPPYVITPLEGLAEAIGVEVEILRADESDLDKARDVATQAEAVIVVVGYTHLDEGEFVRPAVPASEGRPAEPAIGGDRVSLRLDEQQRALVDVASKANPRTIVLLVAGAAVLTDPWADHVGAILQTFYSGMEGGRALAQLVFGDISPSGKLPFSVPRSEQDLPPFESDADSIVYGPLHGYTLLDAHGKTAAYPFGFGLSYTEFGYRALRVRRAANTVELSIAVTNLGAREGEDVVQAYVGFPGRSAPRPKKLLRAFRRVPLAVGETRIVTLPVDIDTLRWWDPQTQAWKLECGEHKFFVGGSSVDAEARWVSIWL